MQTSSWGSVATGTWLISRKPDQDGPVLAYPGPRAVTALVAPARPEESRDVSVEIVFRVVLVLSSLLMILLVLLHKGKGGGLSDLFGGGVSSSLGGSSVVERNLDRLTIGMAIIWISSIIALGLLLKS